MRAYIASPYTSHPGGPDKAFTDAWMASVRWAQTLGTVYQPTFFWGDKSSCVWSPVAEGHVKHGPGWRWDLAMQWCLDRLRAGHFDTLVLAYVPGRDDSRGMAVEAEAARGLGLEIIKES